MFTMIRATIYATLFISLLLIYLPARILLWTGVARPAAIAWPQIAGMLVGGAGAVVALWCIGAFVWFGRGTPAPFDPPRRLVIHGPYRLVRNPMYIGAGLAVAGAALFYESMALLAYGGMFLFAAHLFVVFYEEPVLRGAFGPEYESYCLRVRRWLPGAGATR
ncbi:MAG: isoprenylcysteine carboxylmethyltransferase family protein [Terracidiphilus sp.]